MKKEDIEEIKRGLVKRNKEKFFEKRINSIKAKNSVHINVLNIESMKKKRKTWSLAQNKGRKTKEKKNKRG